MSNRRDNQYSTRPLSQPRPRVPASSPLPILRSTQQHAINNIHQRSTVRNRTVIPVYVYPEHLAAIQQFLLALGQPLILDPAGHGDFPAEPEEVDDPVSPLSGFQGAGGFDGGYSPNESELTSSMSRVTLSSAYISSTPSTASSTRRSHLFTSTPSTASSTRRSHLSTSSPASPTPAARHSHMAYLPLNTAPSASHQASPNKKKYYCVTIGKKTGVFWDEWDNIDPLVKKVSGSRYKSFPTHEQALAHYSDAKRNGRVEVIRDPGDDEIYGPWSEAEQ